MSDGGARSLRLLTLLALGYLGKFQAKNTSDFPEPCLQVFMTFECPQKSPNVPKPPPVYGDILLNRQHFDTSPNQRCNISDM